MKTQQKLKKYLEEIKKNDKKGKKINAFLQLRDEKEILREAKKIDDKIKSGKSGKLAGMIFAVKANINVDGLNISCASKTLENYKGTYDADVIRKIKEEDGLIIGITNMDEFACGSSGETSAFGPTRNPRNAELVPGGSSSGSAAAVAAGFCDAALGSDTGGSIRNPASHCGIIGLKPTYGSVSRYGLIDLSMSLDQIGVLAKNSEDAERVFEVIKGKSENDATSLNNPVLQNKKNKKDKSGKLKVGVLDFHVQDERIQKLVDEKIERVKEECGWNVEKVKIPYLDLAIETYYPLVYVEFYSGTRRFDGRKYGLKIEDSAGPEVLRRILGGSEITKAEHHGRYYHQALKVKNLIEKEFEKVFEKYDCIVSPTVPRLPHKIGEKISVEEMYSYDALTNSSNIAGNCAISVPVGEIEKTPVGMQIVCDKFEEKKLFDIAGKIEGQ